MDAITLNNNLPALMANRLSEKTKFDIAKIRERFTTGLRINSAADDASGLAMSTHIESSILTLQQGLINMMDGVSITQVVTGALSEYISILRRLRELSTRASSETLSDLARENLQAEVDQLIDHLKKLAHETKFNGVSLLDKGTVTKGPPKVVALSPIERKTFGDQDTLPDLSPDGTKLVFTRGSDIFIKDFNTGTETQLTAAGTGSNRYAAFSPDGTKIVFSSSRVTGTSPEGDRELYTMNLDGSGLTQLTTNAFDDSHARYSPSGSNIVYMTGLFTADAGQDIATIDSTLGDGGGVTQVTTSSNFNYHPSYSPDGTTITYTTDLAPPSSSLHINTIPSGGGVPTNIAHNYLQMEGPVYSPDGDFIYFRSAETGAPPFNYGLYVANSDGSSVSNFSLLLDFASPADEGRPSVSSDTGMIAFSSDTTGAPNIYTTTPYIKKTYNIYGDNMLIHVGESSGEIKKIYITNVDPAKIGLTSLDITTFSGAQRAMLDVESALDAILGEMAKMGAQENTLEMAHRANSQYVVNLQASNSRIEDADMAKETTEMAKGLILERAQTAIKAQANMLATSVLKIIATIRDNTQTISAA